MNPSNTRTHVRCQRPPIPAALLTPFSAGEIISHASVIKLDAGEPAPLAFRPFGNLSMEGEVARADATEEKLGLMMAGVSTAAEKP